MNTSKLILSFSCGKVNFSRSIFLLKRGVYMSEEMEVACLWCLSDDKLPAETFWVVCQMTNCPQRRFEPFVRWQIVPRDVLSRLSDDKSSPETFWDERLPPPQEKWRFESISILEFLLERVFLWIATLTLAMTGMRSLDCHADARDDGLGIWVYKNFFTKIVSGGNLSKVFPRARG